MEPMLNVDSATVAGFGDEWTRFDQSRLPEAEHRALFEGYFKLFPWSKLPLNAVGFDAGCGSGRWAQGVAPRVGLLHCLDASEAALAVAKRNLSARANCAFHHASVGAPPFAPESMDFGYSLGVLHHVPDTQAALAACVRALKPGAPFLLYLYYALDNRPYWFRSVWRGSDILRRGISKLPHRPRYAVSQVLAFTVYYPLSRAAYAVEKLGGDPSPMPLAEYRHRSLGTMRTDALDRFGTRLEKRFTRKQMVRMMNEAGLQNVQIGDGAPYWCGVGFKA